MLKHEPPGQTAPGFNYPEVTGESLSNLYQITNIKYLRSDF